MRLTAFEMAASIVCAGTAQAQLPAAVQDLGNGMDGAIGAAVGVGGGAEAQRVAVAQFDGNRASMFGTPAAAYSEIVRLAAGTAKVAPRARQLARTDPVRDQHLADMALAAEPNDVAGVEARLEILKVLDRQSTNSNERGWRQAGIGGAEARLKR